MCHNAWRTSMGCEWVPYQCTYSCDVGEAHVGKCIIHSGEVLMGNNVDLREGVNNFDRGVRCLVLEDTTEHARCSSVTDLTRHVSTLTLLIKSST